MTGEGAEMMRVAPQAPTQSYGDALHAKWAPERLDLAYEALALIRAGPIRASERRDGLGIFD